MGCGGEGRHQPNHKRLELHPTREQKGCDQTCERKEEAEKGLTRKKEEKREVHLHPAHSLQCGN